MAQIADVVADDVVRGNLLITIRNHRVVKCCAVSWRVADSSPQNIVDLEEGITLRDGADDSARSKRGK